MNSIGTPPCPICGEALSGFDVDCCFFCRRFMCRRHLNYHHGLANCADCEGARAARELAAVVTKADQDRLFELLRHDLASTVGPRFERLIIEEGEYARLQVSSVAEYDDRVIGELQQRLHDEFIDTTWPACPRHLQHPLWYSDGWWRCPSAGPIARAGELGSSQAS